MGDSTPTPEITVYGAHWCPDCRRSKQFLGEHQIPYAWVDIEQDKDGEAWVLAHNDGKRIIPLIAFADGSQLVEPSNAELAAKLGLKQVASRHHYDLIIIGGGPAGLTAGLYTAREGIETLVIERAAIGGQAAATDRLDNVPGFAEGVQGAEFARQLRRQVERFGAELLQAQDVTHIHSHDNYHCVTTEDGSEYSAYALLLVTGSRYRRLNVPGEANYIDAGIHFCATCDGPFYKGQDVVVIGGGNSAAEESIFLTRFAKQVTLLVRGAKLAASRVIEEKLQAHPQITVQYQTEVIGFGGEGGKLTTVETRAQKSGTTASLHPDGVFVFIGLDPNTDFLADSGVRRSEWGFVITGHDLVHDGPSLTGFGERAPVFLETSVPGIFAAGDLRQGSTQQVAAAAGEGASAALLIREYLKTV
jgi:thioredoxin reductase (NADPH)